MSEALPGARRINQKDVPIGKLRRPEDPRRLADILEPCYRRELWTWADTKPPSIPDAARIAKTIAMLWSHVKPETAAVSATGGLAVKVENGESVLYAARPLDPHAAASTNIDRSPDSRPITKEQT